MTLIERIEGAENNCGNFIDVKVEIALFKPDKFYKAVRANAAGTKLIYTRNDGTEQTCWAEDWTADERRADTLAALRAIGDTHDD